MTEIPWWWSAVIVPVAIALWKFFEAKLFPLFQKRLEQDDELEAMAELSEIKLLSAKKLAELNTQAYGQQMLTQALSEAQYEAATANDFMRTTIDQKLDIIIQQIERDHTLNSEFKTKVLATLINIIDELGKHNELHH